MKYRFVGTGIPKVLSIKNSRKMRATSTISAISPRYTNAINDKVDPIAPNFIEQQETTPFEDPKNSDSSGTETFRIINITFHTKKETFINGKTIRRSSKFGSHITITDTMVCLIFRSKFNLFFLEM